MIILATERSTYLDVDKIDWEPTRFPGVYIKKLYEDAILKIAETTVRAGFTELMLFPFAGGDLRSGVERAARLLPRMRALAR